MAAVTTLRRHGEPAATGQPLAVAATSHSTRHNWAFYAFVMLIPLQNIYSQYLPNLGGGLNFLNVMFIASLLMAMQGGGRLVRGTGVNGWTGMYIAAGLLATLIGYGTVADPAGHFNAFKDQAIAISFLFLAQASATDWNGIRRLLLLSLVPVPYMTYVLWDQHSAVSSWHYDHALRVSGTFIELGANEFAAFCTTLLALTGTLLFAVRNGPAWRWLLLAATVLAATGVVLTYSRTAYVAVLLCFGTVAVLYRARARLLLPGLLLVVLVPMLLPNSAVQRFESIEVEEGQRDESTDDRFRYWDIAYRRFLDDPVIGTGYHTFHHWEINPFRTDTHNFYLRELVEKGLLGVAVLFGMLLSIARLLLRMLRRSATGSWAYGLALGMLGAFVALLCGNLFGDRFTHYPMIAHFWLYLGLALRGHALQEQVRQHERALRREPSRQTGWAHGR